MFPVHSTGLRSSHVGIETPRFSTVYRCTLCHLEITATTVTATACLLLGFGKLACYTN